MVKLIRSTGSGKNYDSGDLVKENTGRLGCYLVDLGDLGDDFALWTKDVCPGRYGTRQTVAARFVTSELDFFSSDMAGSAAD